MPHLTNATVADVRAIIVVTEKDSPTRVVLRANRFVVRLENVNSMFVSFRTIIGASTVPVVGDDNQFTRKRGREVRPGAAPRFRLFRAASYRSIRWFR